VQSIEEEVKRAYYPCNIIFMTIIKI